MKVALSFLIVIALLLTACKNTEEDYISFEEVSQPYLDKYGEPDDKGEDVIDGDQVIIWMWMFSEKEGLMVIFVNSEEDDVNGWRVASETPIIVGSGAKYGNLQNGSARR